MIDNSNSLLEPLEAAHLLGITPELLFAYVRNAPKGQDGRRLVTVQYSGQTYFRREDLLSFDDYLKEPWSPSGGDRANIPAYVLTHIKVECGGQCARCGRGFKLETAHIEDYATSRSHHHHNLIRLCSLCHEEFDSRTILPDGEIVSIKKRLIEITRERLTYRIASPGLEGFRPPTPTEIFIGRMREVQKVVDGLNSRRILCIKGPGGIGKTQLALHSISQMGASNRVLWMDVEPFDSIADLQLAFASAILGPVEGYNAAAIAARVDLEFDLVAFDGIEGFGSADIEAFECLIRQMVEGTRSIRFLITSQVELLNTNDLLCIDVPPLSTEASLQMLEAIAENAANPDNEQSRVAIDWLTDFAAGHTLSLRIIANLLRYFKSAAIVAERVRSKGAAAIAIPRLTNKTKHHSLDACFAVAYSVLQPEERSLLFMLSQCPAGRFSSHINADLISSTDIDVTIAELARWHLVTVDSSWYPVPRVHVLSPIRAFARLAFQSEAPDLADYLFHEFSTEMEVLAAMLDSRYINDGDPGIGTRRFGLEFPNFSYVFDESVRRSTLNPEYDRITCSLAFSLQVFCFVSGRSARGLQILNSGVKAALRMKQVGIASSLLLQVANFAERSGAIETAHGAIHKICSLEIDHTDPEMLGNIAFARGSLARNEGRFNDAEAHFVEAGEQYAQPVVATSGKKGGSEYAVNPRMFALALMERARILEHSERQLQALEIYSDSLSLMREINDRVNIGTVLHQMGNCYAHLNQLEKAYRSYVDAANCFFDVGSAIHLSNSLSEMGYVLIDYNPGPCIHSDLSEELVLAGLSDVFHDCASQYQLSSALKPQECIGVIRKLFGMVALVSFTSHRELLQGFADDMCQGLVVPLAVQVRGGQRKDPSEQLAIMHLDVMTALAGSLSAMDIPNMATNEEIGHLAGLCHIQAEHAWRIFRLFDWLVAYMSRCRARADLNTEQLIAATGVSNTTGKPFRL